MRSVPQSMQGVHRVIQSLPLFDVVSGHVEQIPCPQCNCFLCLGNALAEFNLINLKERGLYNPRYALPSRDSELSVFIIPPCRE